VTYDHEDDLEDQKPNAAHGTMRGFLETTLSPLGLKSTSAAQKITGERDLPS